MCLSRFKQRGRAAEDACNIFYYLTYEGAVDLEAIQDPLQRQVQLWPAMMSSVHSSHLQAACGELMSQEAGATVARGKGGDSQSPASWVQQPEVGHIICLASTRKYQMQPDAQYLMSEVVMEGLLQMLCSAVCTWLSCPALCRRLWRTRYGSLGRPHRSCSGGATPGGRLPLRRLHAPCSTLRTPSACSLWASRAIAGEHSCLLLQDAGSMPRGGQKKAQPCRWQGH